MSADSKIDIAYPPGMLDVALVVSLTHMRNSWLPE
jgi:hypothetical protein